MLAAVRQPVAVGFGAGAPGVGAADESGAGAGEDGRWVARELANDPGRALSEALRCTRSKTFAAYLNTVSHHDVEQLRLGKKTEQLLAEAEQLHRQIDQYAYGPPTIRFAETDIDQTRAAGVLIELERTTPIIVD